MRVHDRRAVPVLVGFDHEIPAAVSVGVAPGHPDDECAIAAPLAAAVTAALAAHRPVADEHGLKAQLRAHLAEGGIDAAELPLHLDAPLSEWVGPVAAALRIVGLRTVVTAWLACLSNEGDGETPGIAWAVDDPRLLGRLVGLLFEILDCPGDRWVVTSPATWTAVMDDARIADRCAVVGMANARLASDAADRSENAHLERAARAAVEAEARELEGGAGSRIVARPGLEAASDRARSAAEALLFAVLERRPRTRGVFVLNATTSFAFGGRACEIDLCARSLRLAIEIDGYFHFVDPSAWRRDRRKDLLLQMHGYTVLRFLAEDVVEALPVVLETIDHAIACGRARSPRQPAID